MKTHDYREGKRYWGHDYIFDPIDRGTRGHMMGWGNGIEVGDYLLMSNENGETRYRVERIKYFDDPPDMWSADVVWSPRKGRLHLDDEHLLNELK